METTTQRWEFVTKKTDIAGCTLSTLHRFWVPNGWIYRYKDHDGSSMVFVPRQD